MKTPKDGSNYFFVDESGDPTFYDRRGNLIVGREGCSPILLLGLIETQNPEPIRQGLLQLQQAITNDPYFRDVPSMEKTRIAFHAKDDLPEVRFQVYKLLSTFEFKAQFVVARKIEQVFRNNFRASERQFYDHLVSTLFKNVMHRYQDNYVYVAKRGSRDRQSPLSLAIENGMRKFETTWNTKITTNMHFQVQTPAGEPCLSLVDYMNWAVYRAFTRGEMRYYAAIEEKVSLLVDLYDKDKYPNNWYSRKNSFDIKKITPLQLGSFTERTT